jgi:hypothetical protein
MVAEINASPTTGHFSIGEWLQYPRPPVDELMKPRKAGALGNQLRSQGLAIRVDDPNLGKAVDVPSD